MPPIDSPSAPVYLYGHVTAGIMHRLRDAFPAANGYGEIVATAENYCGEATGSALVLRRLGVPVEVEGNWIGDNETGRRTLAFLRGRGVGVEGLKVKSGYAGVTEVVFTDRTTRTVFGRYIDLFTTTVQWEAPDPERIATARMVCIDPGFGETSRTVARIAGERGIPFVTSDSPLDSILTTGAAATVISHEGLAAQPSLGDEREAFERYCEACPGLVVFTHGEGTIWWGRGRQRGESEAFAVETIDTAGAGDSFRGGLIYGLLQGWPDARAIRFATAVAALVCTTFPGVLGSPDLATVEAFLAERAG